MHRPVPSRRLLAAGLLAVTAVVAACGGSSSSPAAASSASSSAAPSSAAAASGAPSSAPASGAAASAAPGSSAGASSGTDALLDVSISSPYTLADLPAATADAIQAGIEKNLGAYGKAVHVGVRQVKNGPTTEAYLMVVAFPRGTLSDEIYGQVVNNLSMGAEQSFDNKLVKNVPVAFGGMGGGSVAVFRTGDLALITLSVKQSDLTPIVEALITANG